MLHPSRITVQAVALLLLAEGAVALPPTMDSLWPSDDGRSWRYDQHFEEFDANPLVVDNVVRIFFDGVAIAPNAIQTQYLRESASSAAARSALFANAPGGPFERQLWLARPDLREKLARVAASSVCPENAPSGGYTLLLGGELAYRKTADEIASWRCNLADTRSWQWLASDLTIGQTFTLQLVPDLADNVFLHGTIGAIESSTVPAGTFEGCVRVDYVVDYGLSQCTDAFGNPTGTVRSETRGFVRYAPSIGPVESFEEYIPVVEFTGSCAGLGDVGAPTTRATLRLNSSPTAVILASWGRLKASYH